MQPVDFVGQNIVFAKDQKEYLPLPALLMQDGAVITCWALSDEDIDILLSTRRLWFSQLTFGAPYSHSAQVLNALLSLRGVKMDYKRYSISRDVPTRTSGSSSGGLSMPRPVIDISCPTDHMQCSACFTRCGQKDLMVLRIGSDHRALCAKCRELLRRVLE